MSLALVLDADPEDRALRAVLYGRQSKGKAKSIAEQLFLGEARCERQGWPIVDKLSDAISASRFAAKERTDWPRLVGMVRAGEVDVIWLWESSRGDRKLSTWASLLELCQERGIFIWVEDHGRLYDLRNHRDMRTLGEEGTDNVHESSKIADRTNRAKEAARRDGVLRTYAGGPPPTGYTNGEDEWETYQPVADLLNAVADAVIAGESLSEAYRRQPLVETPRFSKKVPARVVNEKAVRAALARPHTAGLMTQPDGSLRQVIDCPPLDPDKWYRLRAIFASRKRGPNITDQYIFGPVLRCGTCGNQMTGEPVYYRHGGQVKRRTPSYRCKNPHPAAPWRVTEPCRGVSVPADEVNEMIRDAVGAWASSSRNLAEAREHLAGLGQQRIELEAELASAQERMAMLGDNLGRGWVSREHYEQSRQQIGGEIDARREQLARLEDEEATPPPVVIDWETMPPARQVAYARLALDTPVTVAPGKGGARPVPTDQRVKINPRRQLAG